MWIACPLHSAGLFLLGVAGMIAVLTGFVIGVRILIAKRHGV